MMGIKDFGARFRLRFRLKNHQSHSINIPGDLNNRKNIVICLPPDQRELTMIRQLLPAITALFSTSEIYLLASPGSQVYAIFPRKGYRILTPSQDQLTWSGLAKKSYIKNLHQTDFDLILDLNLVPNYFIQSILLSFPKAIRIGGCNKLGMPYYNLEIKSKYIRDEKNIYRSIIDMLDRLKYSRPAEDNELDN
jgi:hypothetical protein